MSNQTAPAIVPQQDLMALMGNTASPALQIMLNDALFSRCKEVAKIMAAADGVTPKHLLNKPEACFSVVSMSIIWKLAPMMVAGATYQTPGGQIGYEGKLCQAIIENSGQIEGQVKYEYYGDWTKILGKFRKEKSQKGHDYIVPNWKDADEEGLGVIVSAQVRGEAERREFDFLLKQAFPRNSTLWASDPKTQLGYAAVRRFGSVAMPGIFMGVPFDREEIDQGMVDITPPSEQPKTRPTRASTKTAAALKTEDEQRTQHVRETVIEDTDPAAQTATVTKEKADAPKEQTRPEPEPETEQGGGAAEADQGGEQGSEGPAVDQDGPDHAEDSQTQEVLPPEPTQQAKPAIAPLTDAELKAGRTAFEKDVLAAKDSMSIDAINAKHRPFMKRLKVTDQAIYEKLISVYSGRKKYIDDQEEANNA